MAKTTTTAPAEAEAHETTGPTLEALQARVAELEQQLQAQRQQAAADAQARATELAEARNLAAERAREIELLLAERSALQAALAQARQLASPPPPAPPAGRAYRVISPLHHHGKPYGVGSEVSLTEEEAEPLLGHTVQPA